jgi:hypothetical protein
MAKLVYEEVTGVEHSSVAALSADKLRWLL